MILGDAYLQKTGENNARLGLEHRRDHAGYLAWKAHLLPQLFQGAPTFLTRIHPHSHQAYSYVRQQSNASPYLGKLRKLFYPDGKKKIPAALARWLKLEIGFAIWFCDDGHYFRRDRAFSLYLGTVSREEAAIASDTIRKNFGIASTILDKKSKGFVLYFPSREREKVILLLSKYRVPCMAYKIPALPLGPVTTRH